MHLSLFALSLTLASLSLLRSALRPTSTLDWDSEEEKEGGGGGGNHFRGFSVVDVKKQSSRMRSPGHRVCARHGMRLSSSPSLWLLWLPLAQTSCVERGKKKNICIRRQGDRKSRQNDDRVPPDCEKVCVNYGVNDMTGGREEQEKSGLPKGL